MQSKDLYKRTFWCILFISLYVSIGLILQSCANISAPSGGIKDTKPPKVLSSYPNNLRTNFKGKRIVINFDEKIDVSKLKEKIIISPSIDNEFEVEAKGKSVVIEFKKPLSTAQDTLNKTFTINFGDGLKDVNEGNSIPYYKLVFSTGNRLDSGKVTGLLTDGYTKDTVQNAVVGLYLPNDTLDIKKHKPEYYTYSTLKGKYILENIKPGEYLLYAFADKNKNQIADVQTEKLGFINTKITISNQDSSKTDLTFSRNDLKVPKLISPKNEEQFSFIFDEGLYQYTLESEQKLYHTLSPNRKSIIIYKNDLCEDSTEAKITVMDSSYNDTIYNVKVVQNTPKKITKYKDLIKTVEPPTNSIYLDSINIKITTNDPLMFEKDSSVILNTDSASFKLLKLNKDFKVDNSNTIYSYTYKSKFKPKRFVELIIKSNKLKSSKGDTNTLYKYKYVLPKPVDESEIPKVGIAIETNEPDFYVELLSEKSEVVNRQHNTKKIIYRDLQPAIYSIRILADPNHNGKWDNGNYTKQLLPEKVKVYKKILVVRKNWDIEDMQLDF